MTCKLRRIWSRAPSVHCSSRRLSFPPLYLRAPPVFLPSFSLATRNRGQKWTEPPMTSSAPLKLPAGFKYQPCSVNISENIGLKYFNEFEISEFISEVLDSCVCLLMRVFEANGMVGWVTLICVRNFDRSQEVIRP